MEFKLSYARILCLRCGDKRIRGVPCSTCGLLPDEREADPARQRRQKFAQEALSILDASLPQTSSTPLSAGHELWDLLSDLFEEYLAALPSLTTREPKPLLLAVERLRDVKLRAASTPRYRPWLDFWNAWDRALESIEKMVRAHLHACAADTPLAAQRLSERAQAAIDDAALTVRRFNDQAEKQSAAQNADTPQEAMAFLTEKAFSEVGAQDILDFDQAGINLYRSISGDTEPPPGAGLLLQTAILQVEALVDLDRVLRVARETFGMLASNPTSFLSTVCSQVWSDDFSDSLVATQDAGIVYGQAMVAAKQPRQAARALMDFAHTLVEQPGKRYVATLLVPKLKKSYEQLRTRDAGGLLNTASQHALGPLLEGIDGTLRVAKAHESYRVEGEQVALYDRGRLIQKLSFDELIDRTLTGLESVVALQLGIVCVGFKNGLDVTHFYGPDLLDAFDLSAEERIQLTLAFSGWAEMRLEIADRLLTVEGRNDAWKAPESKLLPAVATIFPYVPRQIPDLRLEWTDESGNEHIMTGPTEPFFDFIDSNDDFDRQCASLKGQALWTFDGKPFITTRFIRKFAAVTIGKTVNRPLSEIVPILKKLALVSRQLGDSVLEESVNAILAVKRSQMLGLPHSAEIDRAFRRIAEWERDDVEQIEDS
jgi:hypothetical protein